jgi:inosose dehydratase
MNATFTRRDFSKAIALGVGAAAVPALRAAERRLKIGYTALTWGASPGRPGLAPMEQALKDMSGLGFWAFETFSKVLEELDTKGELRGLIDKYKVPLNAGYFTINVIDPVLQKANVADVIRQGKVVKKYGGTFLVLQVNSLKREDYDFKAHRADIISNLNDCSLALNDIGIGSGLHQHTGTAVETRDEVYAVMEAVNTRYMKFAPDIGQLQRGGSYPVKVVKDFLSITEHMHVKDWDGVRYCPLGQGKVDIAAIMDMVEASGKKPDLNVELDSSKPQTPLEAAQTTKAYLQKIGYKFAA